MLYALTLIAGLSAMLSAVAGIGGGTILIAAMYTLGMSPVVALTLHAGVQCVSNFSRAIAYRRDIDWRHGLLCVGVAVPMPFLVAPWLVRVDADWLRLLLGAFVLVNLLPRPPQARTLSLNVRMIAGGVLKGAVGPIVGASGLLLAPFFFSEHWRKEQTVATLAMVQAAGHAVKLSAYAAAGVQLGAHLSWFPPLAIAVMLGTLAGKRVMGRISADTFQRILRGVMLVLGLKLLLDGLLPLLAG